MRIIIDSLDKRMTAPVIDYLVSSGFEVHGICYETDRPLNPKKLKEIHTVSRRAPGGGLGDILSRYSADDVLIAGNPGIIAAVNDLKPDILYLLPPREAVEKATDKRGLMELAASLGIRTPKALSEPGYPMIAKLNVSENVQLKPAERYRIIRSDSELKAAGPFLERHRDNLILQEYVEGPGRGVALLLDGKSDLIDFIVYERLLEYPVTGGPSAACRSIVCPELAGAAFTLLRGLGWQGFAMVEFKGEALLEVNPRFWGSLPLLFVAKSDFFGNYIKILQNKQTAVTPEAVLYRQDKKMTYFPQGILSVLALAKAGKIKRAAAGVAALIGAREGIFRLKNPVPFLNYLKFLCFHGSGKNSPYSSEE